MDSACRIQTRISRIDETSTGMTATLSASLDAERASSVVLKCAQIDPLLPDEIYQSPNTSPDNCAPSGELRQPHSKKLLRSIKPRRVTHLGRRSSESDVVTLPARQVAPESNAPAMPEPYAPCDDSTVATISLLENGMCSRAGAFGRHTSAEIEIGSIIDGRYEILSEIAHGGYGVVYRARQIGVNRIVALKRLLSQRDPAVVQRFLLESSIIKDLIHPNTIQLIDSGIDANHMYIVMEYIEGNSLAELLKKKEVFPPLRALKITRQILKSVNEAHQRGIIHRDLKPSNILVRNVIGESDFVKVLDFGIAKVQNNFGAKITCEGSIMGTPQYIAPEAFVQDTAHATADLFSVGLILYEMLTGKAVIPNKLQDAIVMLRAPEPIPLPAPIAKTPFEPFLRCALEKDPQRRFQTAEAMLEALDYVENLYRHPSRTIQKTPFYLNYIIAGSLILIVFLLSLFLVVSVLI